VIARAAVLGLHFGEIVFTAFVVALVFGWSLAPKLGERIGRALSRGDRDA
jgi:hypothetical protein